MLDSFCKGTLKGEESTELFVSLVSSRDEFQVSSSGHPGVGTLWAPVLRQFWKERHHSIIYNDVRDAVVEFPELLFQAAAAIWYQQFLVRKTGSSKGPVRSKRPVFHREGSKVLRHRCSGEVGMLLWVRLLMIKGVDM